jgi:uncharacterized protein (DUF58 family)
MITQRAALLGFVGFCFYLIALVNSLPGYYYALTWLTVGMLVACLGISLLSLVGLTCHWEVARTRASEPVGDEGETVTGPVVRIHLANGGTLNKTGVLLEIRLQRVVDEPKNGKPSRDDIVTRRFLLEAIPSGQSVDASLALPDLPRGRYQLIDMRLTGSDVLGLFRTRRRLVPPGGEQEIIVGPAILSSPAVSWLQSAPGRLAGDVEARFRVGQGDDLRGTRPYVPGDDLRHVHWKSTARAGELVVKEFHHRGRGSSLVIWDGAANTDWGNGEAVEWGLRLAASLCYGFAIGGSPCVLARLDSTPLALDGRGGEDLHSAVTEVLADARADRAGPVSGAAGVIRGQYEEVFIVTASLSKDVVQLASQWTRANARSGRVAVALIDGASLGKAARDRRFVGRGPVKTAPQQVEETPSGDGTTRRVAYPVTELEYEERVQDLRAIGAQVVLVRPAGNGAGEFAGPITAALRVLFLGGDGTNS